MTSDDRDVISREYLAFAEQEALAVSPLYAVLAAHVAASEPLLEFIAALPPAKRQPNLLLAAVRRRCGTPADGAELERFVASHPTEIRALILARRTQTNEPGRCAVLLPALARLPQPLALLEVGASAGLCLLPDRYGYDYGRVRLAPRGPAAAEAPIFPCEVNGATPLPTALPEVVWRAGIDLNPLDVADPETLAWLEALVWPGQEGRVARLRAALRVARAEPPRVEKGDLLRDLRRAAAGAPTGATLVVFHTAVLVYVAPSDRARFVREVSEIGARWISNESPGVFPDISAKLSRMPPPHRFLLALDGEPLALTAPHGQSLEWIAR